MSSIKLESNASGTGIFTIASPNSNTNRTLTLPDSSGTLALAGSSLTGVTDSASPFETALGTGAGGSNTGVNNTFIGYNAGTASTTGADNTAVGYGALDSCTTGLKNVAIGYNALGSLSTGREYVAIGYDALANAELTNDGSHTAVGKNAGKNATSGYGSLFLGRDAGLTVTTGALSTYIGYAADASSASVSGELVLCTAYGGTGKGANTAFINANGGSTFNGANSSSWNTTSDQRLKKNIVDNNEGLDIIGQLRVRNFEYRTEEEVTDLPSHAVIKKTGVQLGVIAQELQQVCPDCVTEQSTGVLSVDTDEIFWHMVNAIKDLKAINDAQATRIEALETKVAALEAK